jgi:hypothetical protein
MYQLCFYGTYYSLYDYYTQQDGCYRHNMYLLLCMVVILGQKGKEEN